MTRAGLAIGAAIDLLMAAFLLLVSGWIVDSWNDRVAWTGPVVTAVWLAAFLLCPGAPIVAYRLRKRQAPPGRVALIMWLPAILIVGVSVVGFMISPP